MLVTKHSSVLYTGVAKVIPRGVEDLFCWGQNCGFKAALGAAYIAQCDWRYMHKKCTVNKSYTSRHDYSRALFVTLTLRCHSFYLPINHELVHFMTGRYCLVLKILSLWV